LPVINYSAVPRVGCKPEYKLAAGSQKLVA